MAAAWGAVHSELLLNEVIPDTGSVAGWHRRQGSGASGAVTWYNIALPQALTEPTTGLLLLPLLHSLFWKGSASTVQGNIFSSLF